MEKDFVSRDDDGINGQTRLDHFPSVFLSPPFDPFVILFLLAIDDSPSEKENLEEEKPASASGECKSRLALPPATLQLATLLARLTPRRLRIFSSISGGGGEARRQLVLYSKPGCCLCDGLKEKLSVAFSVDGPHSLHSVDLQARAGQGPFGPSKIQTLVVVWTEASPSISDDNGIAVGRQEHQR
ncbi:Glutaredoxin-like domain-containing protein [Carex littledalei]|uniref:Glutaredoxin-like protein n=1 Tax=Carex littledalei TaxID=544730 RepID=A0A833QYW4_9POAL|nr:Glutaredoxin-like domain-containing protein [Carex littledalei]